MPEHSENRTNLSLNNKLATFKNNLLNIFFQASYNISSEASLNLKQ